MQLLNPKSLKKETANLLINLIKILPLNFRLSDPRLGVAIINGLILCLLNTRYCKKVK